MLEYEVSGYPAPYQVRESSSYQETQLVGFLAGPNIENLHLRLLLAWLSQDKRKENVDGGDDDGY